MASFLRRPNPRVIAADAPKMLEAAEQQLPHALQRRLRKVDALYARHIGAYVRQSAQSEFSRRGFIVARQTDDAEYQRAQEEAEAQRAQEKKAAEARKAAQQTQAELVDKLADALSQTMEKGRPVFVGDLLVLHGYGGGADANVKEVVEVVTPYDPKQDAAKLRTREVREHGWGPEVTEWFSHLKDPSGRIGYRLVLYRDKNPQIIADRRMALRKERVKAEKEKEREAAISQKTPWLADVLSAVGKSRDTTDAKILRRYLKNHGISASITVRRYSMASGLDFKRAGGGEWTDDEARAIARLLIGQVRESSYRREGSTSSYIVDDSIYPRKHQDRSDLMSDYYDPGGVRVPAENVGVIQQIAVEEMDKAGDTLTPLGEQILAQLPRKRRNGDF